MSRTRIRTGIIGVGTHGRRYANHILRDRPELELVGVFRRSSESLRETSDALGVTAFSSASELVDAVDAVIIVTPPSSHAPLIASALDRARFVLVEKPAVATAAEAVPLLERDRALGGRVMVAHTLRYDAVLVAARAHLPEIGRLHYVRLSQRLEPSTLAWQRERAISVGGSVLLTGVHLFDTAAWLLGEEIDIEHCVMEQVLDPTTEDFFHATGRTASGCHVSFEVSKYTTHRSCRVELVGERGQIFGDYQHHALEIGREPGRREAVPVAPVPTVREALADFARFVGGGPNPIPLTEGVRAVALADRCYEHACG